MELRLEVDWPVLEVGADGHGQLFHNASGGRIGPLSGGQPLIGVLRDDSGRRVGGYAGWIAGTGCTVGLPPGEDRLEVVFPFAREHVGPPTHVLTAPPARVTVTAQYP